MSESRPARWVGEGDRVSLRVPCQGTNQNWRDETVPCQNEHSYEVTQQQLRAYIAGAPLTDIWPDPDPYLSDPRCEDHSA